jgi:hypothetical protein
MTLSNFYLVLTHPAIIHDEDKPVGSIVPLLHVMDFYIEGIVCSSLEIAEQFAVDVETVQTAIDEHYAM